MSQQSVSQRLHDNLGVIIDNTKPGDRLPSEPDLARQLGVSRATLREAMRTFETQGLIQRKQGSGTYVTHPSGVIASGLEILESIETMAKRTELPVTVGEWKIERRTASKEEAKALGLDPQADVLHACRVILAEDRPVAYLVDILPADLLTPQEVEKATGGSILDLLIERNNPSLLTSRTEINAVTARSEVARSMGIQRGDVLLCFTAYLYATDGQVVDYSFSYFLPGYFNFHVIRRVGKP